MWVGIEKDEEIKRERWENKIVQKFKSKIISHFGGEPIRDHYIIGVCTPEMASEFPDELYKILTESACCEHCCCYVGVNPVHRRIFGNVEILNSYCAAGNEKVKPKDVCYWFKTRLFFRHLLRMKLYKMLNKKYDIEGMYMRFPAIFLHYNEEDEY